MMRFDREITETRPVGDDWAVTTVEGAKRRYRRQPCETCPWATDSPVGAFPAEAFVQSARSAYDLSTHSFGCHTSGVDVPTTCAGFLLRGAAHNLGIRMSGMAYDDVTDGGRPLYNSYRAMAEANGVPADHPALRPCRDNGGVS